MPAIAVTKTTGVARRPRGARAGRPCPAGSSHPPDGLVERFLPLARKLARRYHRRGGGEPLEDLVQVASLGLVKAARRYDERRGIPFAAYASSAISGELKRHFRDHAWALHVPRGAKDRAIEVNRAIRTQAERNGTTPTASELAQRLQLTQQEVLEAREAWLAIETSSLDAPAHPLGEDEPQRLTDTLALLDQGYELVDHQLTLRALLPHLPAQERRVLQLRFVDELTQADIATRLGVSQMQISRLGRRALARLALIGHDLHPL